jgi:excisionase family DNA binding protein
LDVRLSCEAYSMENNILTVKEVAEYLRIGQRSVYKLIKERKIPAIMILNKWRVDKAQLDKIFRNPHKESDGEG